MSHAIRVITLALLACVVPWMGHDAKADASAQEEIRAAAAAAQRFLKTLDESQAGKAILPPGSPLIANWSNLPARNTRFDRNGVRVGDLSAGQRAALSDFLSKARPVGTGHAAGRGAAEAGGDRRGTIPAPFRLVRPDGRVRLHLLPDTRPVAAPRVLRDRGPLPLHLPEPGQRVRRGVRAGRSTPRRRMGRDERRVSVVR